jgi:purine nucleosidase
MLRPRVGAFKRHSAEGNVMAEGTSRALAADAARLARLQPAPTGVARMVLDTDAANEIDDQFALAYAVLSPERIEVEAIYAAPFHGGRSRGPEDGMLQSYDEVRRVLDRMGCRDDPRVHKGSRAWLPGPDRPATSPAAEDLIARATGDEPLYVVAIGAPTNVASAILTAPEIVDRIVVVWLGGNPTYWHRAVEFNVYQDIHASRVLLECGVALVHVPCVNVTEHLRTTRAEIDQFVRGRGEIGDYLADLFAGYYRDHFARSKPLWDLGPVAWLVNPAWLPTMAIHSPILTADGTWSHDAARHLIGEVRSVDRDAVFGDLFTKLGLVGRHSPATS